jgi:ribonuclease BN (tRNA processing enzyme)
VKVHLLGVRGSTPAPGPEFVRYGGHTSCVALAPDDGPPTLVLDAGTGLRDLPRLLAGAAFTGTMLLGHLHWDHTQGLPFCRAIDREDASVQLFLPDQAPHVPAELLSRWMSPPFFPIDPTQLRGSWSLKTLEEGEYDMEGFHVLAREIPHKGGRTFGYRISDGRSAIAYLSDHGPFGLGAGPDGWGEYHDAALELAAGVDLLIHDSQHTPAEFPAVASFGHTTWNYAVELGRRAGAKTTLLFHHDPNRTDDGLDALLPEILAVDPNARLAVQGETLRI